MATTTNFGWETPDDTDLVKDGAAAMRTLGNSIDTSFVDLKGGTTGQILSKASNTDLDYAWITNDVGDITAVTAGTGITGGGTSGAVTITNDMATKIDAKGDLVVGTGADTYDRLAVGTNGQALLADSTTSTGLKWGSVAANKSFSLINTGGTALTGAATITVSSISAKDTLLIVVVSASSANSASRFTIRLNSDSGGNYLWAGGYQVDAATNGISNEAADSIWFGRMSNNAASQVNGWMLIQGANSSGIKQFIQNSGATPSGGVAPELYNNGGIWNNSSTVSSVSIISSTGNFDNGTIYVYGSA